MDQTAEEPAIAATMTYYGIVFTYDSDIIEQVRAEADPSEKDEDWMTYTADAGAGFLFEVWSSDGGMSWKAELASEDLGVTIDAHGATFTAALDALMERLKPLKWVLNRVDHLASAEGR